MPFTSLPVNNSFTNDWIILKLDPPLTFGKDVRPACLPPDENFLPVGESRTLCWTSGWGAISLGTSNDFQIVLSLFQNSLTLSF